jgi:hypothetical protein
VYTRQGSVRIFHINQSLSDIVGFIDGAGRCFEALPGFFKEPYNLMV